nr:MAG TPA: hypothetical protein [Caudoviricetes sp.]
MTWHLIKTDPPPAGKRVIFGCEDGFVGEGFMAYFEQELRPVRFDGDRVFFGGIITMPKWWCELPEVPEGDST